MISKLFKIFVILVFMLVPNVVFGADVDVNHILSIEKFNIVGSEITIGGYSYLSHIDNYGGKNLTTYIVAYTGEWNDNYINEANCKKGSNCYHKDVTIDSRDMWYARCTDAGCSDTSRSNAIKNRANTNKFTNTCMGNQKEQCLYSNVGFNTTIDLAKVVESFPSNNGESNEIKFMIISKVYTKEKEYIDWSPLRVYTSICKVDDNKSCSNSVKSGDYTFSLNGLAEKIKYDAVQSRARDNTGKAINGKFFSEKETYKVLSYSSQVKEIDKVVGGVKKGTYSDLLLQLDSKLTSDDYKYNGSVLGKKIVPDDGVKTGSTTDGYDYYAVATHVVFQGDLTIKGFKKNVIDIECKDMNWTTNSPGEKKIDLNNKVATFSQCTRREVTSGVDNTYIYVKDNTCGSSRKTINGEMYARIAISTDILINQEGKFTFGNITPTSVVAGKGFTFKDNKYENTITWMNAKMTGQGNPYFQYSGVVSKDGSCSNEVYNMSGKNYCYYNSDDGFKCTNNLNEASFAVLANIVNNNYIKSKENSVDSIGFISCDSNGDVLCDSNKPNFPVSGDWTLSERGNINDFLATSLSVNGVKVANISFGKIRKNVYSYALANSSVVVTGDEVGKAKYAQEADDYIDRELAKGTGNEFYIDFKWNYNNAWPFDLYDVKGDRIVNPSMVNGMDWKLNGGAKIKVTDGYYKFGSNGGPGNGVLSYKYRSISVNNPFPKANSEFSNIAVNWIDWWKNTTNQNRIKNTYSNEPKYKIIISKLNNGENVSIADINAINTHYGSLEGINLDGSSDFVIKEFGTVANSTSYCGLGFFSNNCDSLGV